MLIRLLALIAVCLLLPGTSRADKLVVVAGGGTKAGDCPATEAKLIQPFGVDFATDGTMYIVELAGGRVHRVDTKGVLTVLGGTANAKGDKGDGGPAAQALFNGMHSLCMLPGGDVCLADTWNNRLRKYDVKSGMVSALFGTGKKGFAGDGGPADKADFTGVFSVAIDPAGKYLVVADLDNRRVRKIDLGTGVVTTVAGNGQKGVPADGADAATSPLVDPRAAVADKDGNVWILERGGHALRVVDAKGKIRTVVGTGKAGLTGDGGEGRKATLNGPKHLCIDPEGNVIIADTANHVIRKYLVKEDKIVRVAGTGKKGSAGAGGDPLAIELNEPHGVTFHPNGTLYITDSYNHRVLRLEKNAAK